MQPWLEVGAQIAAVTNSDFTVKEAQAIGGGCINQAYSISDGSQQYFVKLNEPGALTMFEAETTGLKEIHQTHAIRVPQPVCYGKNDKAAWLVLEYLVLTGRGKASELGMQLAALHRITAEQYGWFRDNTIGQTSQINTGSPSWIEFWRRHRLQYQLDLAKANGFHGKLQQLGEQLLVDLEKFFSSYSPRPSLLHGDLWSGNYAYDQSGNPVIFDPAVYYGDREADIAMTELFGGFSTEFYSAYRCDYPLDSGYNTRKVVYNLYHILNHLNLFGNSYRHQAEQMMSWLLAEIR